ncbi:HNH endonuclease family protein [Vibrio diabolicus]|uniref:HNH endonuclease family protein n=1 Tax=Vibrio diabolicus TaxID=50719 RepID=UPI00211AE4F0|nr:HNH endonuclease family protein [Vibrio diabolicus]MCG6283768.1 HNH endonuclease family protein [Vibrio diabolicus]MCR9307228.1 HNH endonuclease family protein [Vibrio diabolicus]
MIKKRALLFTLCFVTSSALSSELIKLSNNGVCHTPESPSYNRTKNYVSFTSLEACIEDGGRKPKNLNSQTSTTNQKYSRRSFGHGWADLDGDCQNSRAEALIEHSTSPITYRSDKECYVIHGRWISPFTGKLIYSASDVDIDHVVPLKWAWEHGASYWSAKKRKNFANDPVNLIAVEASLNRQKGAKDPSEWLPPQNQCQYILRFMRIIKKYNIKPTPKQMKAYKNIQHLYCKAHSQ